MNTPESLHREHEHLRDHVEHMRLAAREVSRLSPEALLDEEPVLVHEP
jgi:hypothetical protein